MRDVVLGSRRGRISLAMGIHSPVQFAVSITGQDRSARTASTRSTSRPKDSTPASLVMTTSARRRFSVARPLGSFASLEHLTRPAALLFHAAHPLFSRGVDKDDQVAQIVPAGLEQDRRIEHDKAISPASGRAAHARSPPETRNASAGERSPPSRAAPRDRRTQSHRVPCDRSLAVHRPHGPLPPSTLAPNRSAIWPRTPGSFKTSCPTASASITTAPRSLNSAATSLLPPPIPPISPITGTAPCRKRPRCARLSIWLAWTHRREAPWHPNAGRGIARAADIKIDHLVPRFLVPRPIGTIPHRPART